MTRICFEAGTLTLTDVADPSRLPSCCQWDERTASYRARAADYASVVMAHVRNKLEYHDEARAYETLGGGLCVFREPRDYQSEAIEAWRKNRYQGLVGNDRHEKSTRDGVGCGIILGEHQCLVRAMNS